MEERHSAPIKQSNGTMNIVEVRFVQGTEMGWLKHGTQKQNDREGWRDGQAPDQQFHNL